MASSRPHYFLQEQSNLVETYQGASLRISETTKVQRGTRLYAVFTLRGSLLVFSAVRFYDLVRPQKERTGAFMAISRLFIYLKEDCSLKNKIASAVWNAIPS